MLGVLVFDTLPGLFIGIAVSLLLLLYRASRPHIAVLGRVPGSARHWADVERHPDSEEASGIKVLRVEGALFFANAEAVSRAIRPLAREPGLHAIVLDAEAVPSIDVSAVRMLDELRQSLRAEGVELLLARDVGQVRDVVRRAAEDPAAARVYATVEDAVRAARPGAITRRG